VSSAQQIPAPPAPTSHMTIGGPLGDAAAVIIVIAVLER
jgi:hypothetical protein